MKKQNRRSRRMLEAGLILFSFVLVGCGADRWSPTDPRVEDPDRQETVVVKDHWEIEIDAGVTP